MSHALKAKPLETLRTPSNTPSEFDSNSGNIGACHRAERKLLSQKLKCRPKPCKPTRKVSSNHNFWRVISPCFANWVLSQDAVHWNVKVTAAATCVIIQYSGSSWNQSNQIINVGQYFAYIFGQFRDFDLLGIWDPHLVRNLAGASLLVWPCEMHLLHMFQAPLGEKMVRSQLQCSCVDFRNLK